MARVKLHPKRSFSTIVPTTPEAENHTAPAAVEVVEDEQAPLIQRQSPCHFSLRVGVFVLVACIVSAAGFPHLATMIPYSRDSIEVEGVQSYRNTLAGTGTVVINKIWNELNAVIVIAKIMYSQSNLPYNVTEDPSNATWDLPIQKTFFAATINHPERRLCYVDAGNWAWSCQDIKGNRTTRLVGSGNNRTAFVYEQNTTGGVAPLRYNALGPQTLNVSALIPIYQFMAIGEYVYTLTGFLNFRGDVSYGFAVQIFNSANQLRGFALLQLPLDEFFPPNRLAYPEPVVADCDMLPCSAVFGGEGLITTTVPLPSFYVDPSTPGATCWVDAATNFTRCRHSIESMGRYWPQLTFVLNLQPEMRDGVWLAFQFQYNGRYYLCTSGSAVVSGELLLSVVISPAEEFLGTFFESRKLVVYTVVGATVGACVLALIFTQFGLIAITSTLDSMVTVLALRSRTNAMSQVRSHEHKSVPIFVFSEIQDLNDAVASLESYLDGLGAILPSVVLWSMRRQVAFRRREKRRMYQRSVPSWILASLFGRQREESDSSETTAMSEVEDTTDSPVEDSQAAVFEYRRGTLSSNVHNIGVILMDEPNGPLLPTQLEAAAGSSGGGMSSLFAFAMSANSEPAPPVQSILQPSRGFVQRRRGVFASISLERVQCRDATAFQTVLKNMLQLNWANNGEFEGFSLRNFIFSFGCYDDLADAEVMAVKCAMQFHKSFREWCAASESGISGVISIAIDSSRYEDVTLVAFPNGHAMRHKIITTSARYTVERLNTYGDELEEPLVVTDEVNKCLRNKYKTSIIDNVRFSPTCMPRLARRGDIRLYRVHMIDTIPDGTLAYLTNHFSTHFNNYFLPGEFSLVRQLLIGAHRQYEVLQYSAAARRFMLYCQLMVAEGHGSRQRNDGKRTNAYYRGEFHEWSMHESEVKSYSSQVRAAGEASAVGRFVEEPQMK